MKNRVVIAMGQLLFVMVMGGCNWKPWGSDERTNDAGVTEDERCTLKVSACRNSCYEANSPAGCLPCCEEAGRRCDEGRPYTFFACPDKD